MSDTRGRRGLPLGVGQGAVAAFSTPAPKPVHAGLQAWEGCSTGGGGQAGGRAGGHVPACLASRMASMKRCESTSGRLHISHSNTCRGADEGLAEWARAEWARAEWARAEWVRAEPQRSCACCHQRPLLSYRLSPALRPDAVPARAPEAATA